MGNLVSGVKVTCAALTPAQNQAFNERAATVFIIVSSFFLLWHALNVARQCSFLNHVAVSWWPRYGLVADQTSPGMLSAAIGLAIAPNLCYTQPLIVGSQIVALAAFNNASGWMFVETASEAVSHLIGLGSVIFPTITIWTLAQKIGNNPDQGWYPNHDPRGYLWTGALVEGLTVLVALAVYLLRARMLGGKTLFCVKSGSSDVDNKTWQMGWPGIVARRAYLLASFDAIGQRMVCQPPHCDNPQKCVFHPNEMARIRLLTRVKVGFVTMLVALASVMTGFRAIFTFKDALRYNGANKQAALYSAAFGTAMLALFIQALSTVVTAVMTF